MCGVVCGTVSILCCSVCCDVMWCSVLCNKERRVYVVCFCNEESRVVCIVCSVYFALCCSVV